MTNIHKQGVLLVNLGTPDAPTVPAVKQFLSEFLHDHRVVDMTRWLWCPILHGVILPFRAPKVTKLYQSIWMAGGSPLRVYSQQQVIQLAQKVAMPVASGMTYGQPTIQMGIMSLLDQGVTDIIVLPLYPQYSGTTTGAVYDGVNKVIQSLPVIPGLRFINSYYDRPAYIKALAERVRASWDEHGQGDYLLCSYHGIPKRYADQGDIYPQHCAETTRLLAEALNLKADQIGMSYQSRFGREEWLQPYTDKTLEKLAHEGTKALDIVSPAFSVDCLETLEELSHECRDIFIAAGGETFTYIPCLNADDAHIEMMAGLVAHP